MLSRLSSFSGPLSKLFSSVKGFTLDGLILRYEISDVDSYSGTTTVTDLVTNSNATLYNTPSYSSNGYITFDGVNEYLTTKTSLNSKLSPANTSNVISHFIWIYPMDNGVIVTEQGTQSLNTSWHDSQIEMVSGTLKFGLWTEPPYGSGLSTLSSSIATPLYNWYYVGISYDGTTMRTYVNGQSAGTKLLTRATPYVVNPVLYPGLHYGIAATDATNMGDGTYAKMKFGAFHVYNQAITSQEVLNNYNATKSNYIYTGTMSIWIDANDTQSYSGSGTTVTDISGNNYTHTLTGATYKNLYGVQCFDCTTGTNRVVVNGTGPTLPTTGYTYVTWARLEAGDPSAFRTLIYTNSPKYTPITIPNGTNTLGYWDSAFRSSGYGLTSSVGVWVQYAIVGDNSSQTFYINDVQVGDTIAFGSGGRTHWGLGNNDTAGQPWGYVANMMLYNTKLTQAQIKQNYDALKRVYEQGNFVTSNLNVCLLPSSATSSTTWNDFEGNLNATMTGSPSYDSLGYTFDGTSQYGRINSSAGVTDFTNADSYTVEVWFKPSSGQPSSVTTIFEKWNRYNESRYPYVFRYQESTNSAVIAAYDGTRNPAITLSGFTTGNWHQVVGVFNFTTDIMSIYKNGALGSTFSLVGVGQVSNTSPVGIAHRIASTSPFGPQFMFKGSIGVIRIYSSALSSSDILQNFNASRIIYGI